MIGGNMSERVRKARALDAIEKVVDRCCNMAVESVNDSNCLQLELAYDIFGAVEDAAQLYSVEFDWLTKEALCMLRNELNMVLRPMCEVRYVKPCQKDGKTVGMQAKVYRLGRKVALWQ